MFFRLPNKKRFRFPNLTKLQIFGSALFFIIFVNLQTTQAQTVDLSKKITIVAKNQKLSSVLTELSTKGNLIFTYSSQQINVTQNVTLVARNKPISEILMMLFPKISVEYIVVEKQIVLKPKETEQPVNETIKPDPKPENVATLSGFVKDNKTGEVLIGANVYLANSLKGTTTNAYGFYSLSVPFGTYDVTYSYLGYNVETEHIELTKNIQISKQLSPNQIDFEMIVVTQDENSHNALPNNKLSSKIISNNKGLGGEANLNKSLQLFSGVNAFGDGSVYFFTRGGNKDQNMIFIDEAPIYNPSHLFGFFSAVSPDAINDLKFYKSEFPISYSGRLSSVTDIKIKDGHATKIGFSANFSPFTSSYAIDGPLKKEAVTFLVNLRKSHVNYIFQKMSKKSDVKFYDFHTKLNFKLNTRNKLYFSIFNGSDFFTNNTQSNIYGAIAWRNFASTLRWNHLFSDKLFSNLTVFTSAYNYFLYTSVQEDRYWNSRISNLNFKYDLTFFKSPESTTKFGANFNIYGFNPGNLNLEYFSKIISPSKASELIIYFGNEFKSDDKLLLNYGIRAVLWNNRGPNVSYIFDENYNKIGITYTESGIIKSYLNLEPQFNLSVFPRKTVIFKISYNHNVQNIHQLSNSSSPFTNLDVWMPSSPNIKPQKLDLFSMSFHKKFYELTFSAEGFYKYFRNQIEYENHASMLLNPYIEGDLRFGTTQAAGLELSVSKQKGDLTTFLSYSYSRVYRKTKDFNSDKFYPATFDRPHALNANMMYQVSKRLNLTANWTFSSGMRFSSPTAFYSYLGYTIPFYKSVNNDKLPDYHRLDISATLKLNKNETAKFQHELIFSVYNLYGRRNVISVNFNKIETSDNQYVVPTNYLYEHTITPTSIAVSGFVPAIAYSLTFR